MALNNGTMGESTLYYLGLAIGLRIASGREEKLGFKLFPQCLSKLT